MERFTYLGVLLFIFVGSASRELDERPRPAPSDVISHWQG